MVFVRATGVCFGISVTDASFDVPFCVYVEVVIIRYDKVARDRGIVHMITTRAYIT